MANGYFEKGNISNLISFGLLGVGLFARMEGVAGGGWVLAVGLFGFAGGVTNWLAVKMLFDRVPLLYGSGVIPARFREIRQAVKDAIMEYFFDEEYLARFFAERVNAFAGGGWVGGEGSGDVGVGAGGRDYRSKAGGVGCLAARHDDQDGGYTNGQTAG